MSTKLPAIDGAKLVRALQRAGFIVDRVSGSHHVMLHTDGRKTSVPVHAGKTLRRGLLASILNDARLTPDELRHLL